MIDQEHGQRSHTTMPALGAVRAGSGAVLQFVMPAAYRHNRGKHGACERMPFIVERQLSQGQLADLLDSSLTTCAVRSSGWLAGHQLLC
jgi:hypothetical protein